MVPLGRALTQLAWQASNGRATDDAALGGGARRRPEGRRAGIRTAREDAMSDFGIRAEPRRRTATIHGAIAIAQTPEPVAWRMQTFVPLAWPRSDA